MRTSLRVLFASLSTLLVAAFAVLIPAPHAGAVNGVHTVNVQNATCAEGNSGTSVCQVTVSLQGGPNFGPEITATITSTDGTARAGQDYVAVNRNVSWSNGEGGDKSVPVTINGDAGKEPAETFTVSVSSAQQAAKGTSGTVTIPNDDGTPVPTLVITAPAAADEGNTNHNVTVSVSVSDPSSLPMSVNYATSEGTASSDSAKGAPDYTATSGTLNWAANNGAAQNIDIPIIGDTIPEGNETFFLNFGSPNNVAITSGNPANITLNNDDAGTVPALTIDPIPDKIEGDTSQTTQTITVSISPAPTQNVTVDYATSNGTAVATAGQTKGDYETTKGTLTFPANVPTSKTFTVPINGDTVDEADEIYHVTLSNPRNATLGNPSTRDAKILNDDYGQISTVPGQGGGPHVRTFGATGSDLGGFMAYDPNLTSGIHVSRGDFFKPVQTGWQVGADGIDEIVTSLGAYPASSRTRTLPRVTIFATDGTQLASFLAYDSGFGGGVYTAAGNLDGDASNGDELVTAPGAGGGPHVKVWRIKGLGDNAQVINGFYAYNSGFTGGVRVAVGNEIGDAKDDIVTAPGPSGGPHIRVFVPTADGSATGTPGFMAYDPTFTGGVSVAATANRIVTGPGAGGGPHVKVFDGGGTAQGGGFMAYDPMFSGGIWVGLGNLDNNVDAEIVTGAGRGGGPHVKVFRQDGAMPFGPGFFAYDPNFHGGVEVAVSVTAA